MPDVLALVNEEVINPHLQAQTKADVLRELASLLESAGIVVSREAFLQDVVMRESVATTNVGCGVAIPHARSCAVTRPGLAIGKTDGLLWEKGDKEPVKLVFLLAIPSNHAEHEYIKMLSLLARRLVSQEFRNALLAVQTKQEMVRAIALELSKQCE